jgi:hypothetical protein
MSQPETKEVNVSVIAELFTFANEISEALNDVLIEKLGEDGDWENFAGISDTPDQFLLPLSKFNGDNVDLIKKLWALREQANSLCSWNEDHDLNQWIDSNIK